MLYNSLCCWKSSEGWRFCLLLSHPDKDYNLNSLLPLVDCGPTNGRQLGLAWDLELVHRTILKVFTILFCIQAEVGVCLENAYCSSFEVFFFFFNLALSGSPPHPTIYQAQNEAFSVVLWRWTEERRQKTKVRIPATVSAQWPCSFLS